MPATTLRSRLEIASLVFCWLVFTLILAVVIGVAVETGRWLFVLELIGILGLWALLTGLVVRRLWPGSRVARLLADPDQERLEQPVAHGGLILIAVVAAAVVLVLVCARS